MSFSFASKAWTKVFYFSITSVFLVLATAPSPAGAQIIGWDPTSGIPRLPMSDAHLACEVSWRDANGSGPFGPDHFSSNGQTIGCYSDPNNIGGFFNSNGGFGTTGAAGFQCATGFSEDNGRCVKNIEDSGPICPGTGDSTGANPTGDKSDGRASDNAGNPIQFTTGDKIEQVTDYVMPGPRSFEVSRTYRSSLRAKGKLGLGVIPAWSFDHEYTIRVYYNGTDIRVGFEGGVIEHMRPVGPAYGEYRSNRQFDAVMNYTTTPSKRWVIRHGDGRVFTFLDILAGSNTEIRLYRIDWPDGYRRTYEYLGETKKIKRITDSLGRSLTFTHTDDRVTKIQASDGVSIDYVYDKLVANGVTLTGSERLVQVVRTHPGGVARTTNYHYEDPVDRWSLTGISDARGVRYATFAYDGSRRAVLSEYSGGANRVTVSYDDATGTRTVTNAAGRQTIYGTQFRNGRTRVATVNGVATSNCLSSNSNYVYSSLGDVASMTDAEGRVYAYTRNARGLQTRRTEAQGTSAARIVDTEWHPTLSLPTKITTPELETDFNYTASGLLTGKTETDVATGQQRSWSYSWLSAQQAPPAFQDEVISVKNPNFQDSYLKYWTTVTGTPAKGKYSSFGVPNFGNNSTTGLTTVPAASSELAQTITLSPFAYDSVDGGGAEFKAEWNQYTASMTNTGHASLTFLDASDVAIGGPQASPAISGGGGWARRSFLATAPVGARKVKLSLTCTYASGSGCLVWFDDVALSYAPPASAPGVARPARLASVDGPLPGASDTMTYEYDAIGNLTATVNELGQRTDILSVNAVGQPTVIRDPNNVTTNLAYDSENRLITVTVDPGSANQARTDIQYDAIGQVTRIDLPGTRSLEFTYDAAKRLTAIENAAGERREFTHDNLSRVTNVRERSNSGVIATTHDFQFDELGRLLRSIGAAGQTTQFGYDREDNNISVTDPRSKLYTYGFDALDRVIAETDPASGVTQLARRSDGEAVSVEDARSNATSYLRNAWGEITRETSPDTGVTTYVRDARGLVTSMTDARGVTTDFSYDAAGRLLSESFPSSSQNVAYGYDSGAKGVGRLTSVADQGGSATFAYDAQGNVTSATRRIGARNYATAYSYADGDFVTSVTYPSGRIVSYSYGSSGSVTSIRMRASAGASFNDVMTNITHLPMSGPMSESGSAGLGGERGLWSVKSGLFGNDLQFNAAYDGDGRLTSLGASPSGGGVPVQALSFGYDLASNITSITDNAAPARSQSFLYDSLNRLTQATGVYGALGWSYDLVGNRTLETSSAGATSYAISASSNRLTSTTGPGGSRIMTYAASGQLTGDAKAGSSFVNVYDDSGRLIEARRDGATLATYAYDAFEQRVAKTTTAAAPGGASTVHFIHDQFGRLIAEHDGATGAALREYVWLGWMPVAFVDYASGFPVTYYIHVDQVMNPQKLTDASGAVVWDRVQDPFGVEISTTGTLTQALRFPGQYADIETSLNQNWHRDYDPSLGRYVQSDPIGLMGGINTYAYVEGNPLTRVDPDGRNYALAVRGAAIGGGILGRAAAPHIARALVAGGMVAGLTMDSHGNIVPTAANDNEPAGICAAPPPPSDPVRCTRLAPATGIPTSGGGRICRYRCPDGSTRTATETFMGQTNVCSPTKIFIGNVGI